MSDNIFHIQPWSPKVTQVAQDIINIVHSVVPELDVLFMGAAALGLPGKNDIDLDVLCNASDVSGYTHRLIPVLGQPKETKDDLTAWEFKRDGFEIDIILSDPSISHVPEQKKVFDTLKSNKDLLNEYKELKESCDGLPYDEYESKKRAFFNDKVLG